MIRISSYAHNISVYLETPVSCENSSGSVIRENKVGVDLRELYTFSENMPLVTEIFQKVIPLCVANYQLFNVVVLDMGQSNSCPVPYLSESSSDLLS